MPHELKALPDFGSFEEPCFYAFRLPGSDRVEYGCASAAIPGIKPGFVIAPFNGRPITIPSSREHAAEIIPLQESMSYPYTTLSREQHKTRIARAVATLNRNGGKVVLSRTLTADSPASPDEAFHSLCTAYPDAFVFCYRTPQTGTWIGASPELLLRKNGARIYTMALAGTRPAGSGGDWDIKNNEEQQIVTEYIAAELRKHGLSPEISPTSTRRAGPVEHLCTHIAAQLSDGFDIEALLTDLSPTPALGGYPKEDAIAMIGELEDFPRGCYGGYIGPVGSDGDADIFVNLRSMLIRPDMAVLFIGGGITPRSIPAEEWRETELKAATLTRILKKRI